MYLPASFRVEDPARLHELMRRNSFATLVTCRADAPFVTHLPFVVDAAKGPHGSLRAHMARANEHWRQFEPGKESLVIFQGPHAYISPSLYAGGPSVPTWDYMVVHAYGIPRLLEGDEFYAALQDLVPRTTRIRRASICRRTTSAS
jgi:transcriptional regulator